MKKIFFLLSITAACLSFISCEYDDLSTLKGTTWEFSVSGSEALEWVYFYYPISANPNVTYTITFQFTTETEIKYFDRVKGVAYGEKVNEIIDSGMGTYIYDEKEGLVTICDEVCIDAKISKNKLTFTENGVSVVLTKK